MALKQYKPTSPARRGLILVDKSALWKGKPVKALTEGKRKTGGRNNKGHVTSRGIAGGHKQKYRYVDFKRRKWDMPATVERLEYDPNRTAFIALVKYQDGEVAYILAPQRLGPGDSIIAGRKVGAVSNPDNQNQNFAKAGRSRWMGKRPLTRGVAKNPVDHPHGGGEGRTSGGRHPVTPWGKPTKGARTRNNKATDKMIIRSRHAKKKR